jgi:hypothetical protein
MVFQWTVVYKAHNIMESEDGKEVIGLGNE